MYSRTKSFLILTGVLAATAMSHSPVIAGGNPADGRQTFDSICSSCHGDMGVTEIPGIPVFAKGERMNKTDEQLRKSIKNGVNNPSNPSGMTMPPYGGGPALNEKQVSDVIAFIRTLKRK